MITMMMMIIIIMIIIVIVIKEIIVIMMMMMMIIIPTHIRSRSARARAHVNLLDQRPGPAAACSPP